MNKWRSAPEDLVRLFENALAAVPEAEKRKMFGYPCSFVNGHMFAGLHQENMILRLSDEDRARFLEFEGAGPFEPMPGRAMKEYVVVPPALIDSEESLEEWLKKAFAYAKSLPPKPPKKKTLKGTGKLPPKG